jgi:hypothetical protein
MFLSLTNNDIYIISHLSILLAQLFFVLLVVRCQLRLHELDVEIIDLLLDFTCFDKRTKFFCVAVEFVG